jgi:hypothetical protein
MVKEGVNAFKEILTTRLNNILIGSFILSWVAFHAREILFFIYSSNEVKLYILRAYSPSLYDDFIWPMAMTLSYISLLPLISWVIKKCVTNQIFKLEHGAEISRLKTSYKGRKDVAMLAVESTSEYAERYANNNISVWIAERDSTIQELEKYKEENENIKKELIKLKEDDAERRREFGYYKSLYERCVTSVNQAMIILANVQATSPESFSIRNTYGTESLEYSKHILMQLISMIQGITHTINTPPPIPFSTASANWVPPINQVSLNHLSEIFLKGTDGK